MLISCLEVAEIEQVTYYEQFWSITGTSDVSVGHVYLSHLPAHIY